MSDTVNSCWFRAIFAIAALALLALAFGDVWNVTTHSDEFVFGTEVAIGRRYDSLAAYVMSAMIASAASSIALSEALRPRWIWQVAAIALAVSLGALSV